MSTAQSVGSVRELVDYVRALNAETGSRWLFRGQTSATWNLQPSVHRDYGEEEEKYLTQEFRARAGVRHARLPRYEDYADWLALMQHYGLPTRLLDWTYSPLVAAFFAVERTMRHNAKSQEEPTDAAIWALHPRQLNQDQGLKPYVYPLNSWDLSDLVQGAFYNIDRSPKRGTRLTRLFRRASAYQYPQPLDVAAAMAVETDARMQVQRGAFTIHRASQPLNLVPGSESWLRKFVIPGEAVRELGDEVQALGLSLADLFPDLASLARDLSSRIPKKATVRPV
jgi:hypothetical protein